MKVLAIDMDGTLAHENKWRGIGHFGEPINETVNDLLRERENGARIIIHTCRINGTKKFPMSWQKKNIERWLKHHNIPYDEIWTGRGKPEADEYWDNKAVRKGI